MKCYLLGKNCIAWDDHLDAWGGGTPLYKIYWYVPPQRVWFLSHFGLKTGIDFEHFGLKLHRYGYQGNVHESL